MWSDHRFEDYKVLNLVSMSENGRGNILDKSYHMDLYSLKLNSWRRIPCTDFECSLTSGGACVSGVFYHEAYLKQTQTPVILSFDFSTETLSSLPSPDSGGMKIYVKLDLGNMNFGLWTRESVFHVHGVWEPLWFSQDGKLLMFDRTTGKLNHLGVDWSTNHKATTQPIRAGSSLLGHGANKCPSSSIHFLIYLYMDL
ncbi:hypothetical protein SASPL_115606 [Salvia splendens]|uniref:F-box associated beta-propeller type 3 domain-containing protein n=1 Tax=Salvia splendens TaxID=180675 RepID=A0A8X8Y7X0_SALSN|nr:hypothetical protein SASPL_115606 [Salvia splendens]